MRRALAAVAVVLGTCPVVEVAAQTPGEVRRIDVDDLPAEVPCTPEVHPLPARGVTKLGSYGRLRPTLKTVAQTGNPIRALGAAALYEYAARTGSHIPGLYRFSVPGYPHPTSVADMARAFADLAVSGRQSYEALATMRLTRAELAPRIRRALSAESTLHRLGELEADAATDAVEAVIDRAYEVAWALRGPVSVREEIRPGLGWIAVSGEDDRPHRPVNVSSAPFPQRDIRFSVGGRPLVVRAVFMNPDLLDWDPSVSVNRERLPEDQPVPPLQGDVILFLHGHASSAEEALGLAPALFREASAKGRTVTLLSLDLPGYGFGSTVDTSARFSRFPMDTVPNVYDGLVFLERSLDEFVRALDAEQAGFRHRVMGVVGGSLGGNLALRLAGRDVSSLSQPWMRTAVAWSPASVWPSFADDCDGRLGTDGCETFGFVAAYAQRKLAVRTTRRMITDEYDEKKRGQFYSGAKTQRGSQFSNAGKWYRDGFACKDNFIEGGKWLTGEYFSEDYLPWHWRIAHEQLVFSHWDPPRNLMRRYRTFPKLLMIAPEEDNDKPEYLYPNAIRLARLRTGNYGWSVDVADTGHSIHAERPNFLARQIIDFFYENPAAVIVAVTQ